MRISVAQKAGKVLHVPFSINLSLSNFRMEITIKTTTCNIPLKVESTCTIQDVKDNINSTTGIHSKYQELSFSNEVLQDERTLAHYNIGNTSTIDFKLIVPSFDEVLEAISTLNIHISSDPELEKVVEAMITVKAFVDSHSCCASVISDLLTTSADQSKKHIATKMFCENLLHRDHESTNDLINMKKDLADLKVANNEWKIERETLKSEVENLKSEVENLKTFNETILGKVEGFVQFSGRVEQRIEDFSDALNKMNLNQTMK